VIQDGDDEDACIDPNGSLSAPPDMGVIVRATSTLVVGG
jgi:hypothetical protein